MSCHNDVKRILKFQDSRYLVIRSTYLELKYRDTLDVLRATLNVSWNLKIGSTSCGNVSLNCKIRSTFLEIRPTYSNATAYVRIHVCVCVSLCVSADDESFTEFTTLTQMEALARQAAAVVCVQGGECVWGCVTRATNGRELATFHDECARKMHSVVGSCPCCWPYVQRALAHSAAPTIGAGHVRGVPATYSTSRPKDCVSDEDLSESGSDEEYTPWFLPSLRVPLLPPCSTMILAATSRTLLIIIYLNDAAPVKAM